MPTLDEYIKERSVITNIDLLYDGTIAYTAKYSGAKLISQEFDTKLKLVHKELNSETSAACFSPNSKYLAFANANVINILDLKTKRVIKKIKTLSQKITIIAFSSNSEYIIAGSHTGRIFQYKYNNSALLARLCSFPHIQKKSRNKYVSAISIYNNKLACSGIGGAIFVIDLYSQTERNILLEEGPRVNTLCYLDEETLVSGDVSGKILIHSLNATKPTKSIDAPFINITQVIKMPDPRYIMIASDTNYVAIADTHKAKIIHSKYIEFTAPVAKILLVNRETVLVCLENSKIFNLEIPTPRSLRSLIIHNSLYEAYRLVDSEPMLQDTKEFHLLEKRYKSIYREALNALLHQNKNLAQKTVLILKGVRSKEEEIRSLFNAFEKYGRFRALYHEKKYAIAYAMSDKYKALQQTPIFKKLEEAWRDNFVNAQRHIQLDKVVHAKALFHEYLNVASKRELIRLLLTQEKNLMAFLEAIDKKDFQTIDELKMKYPLFESVPTYISLSQTIEKNIQKIDILINQGELPQAKELISKFKNTPHLNQELKRLATNLKSMLTLQKAYKVNDFKSCYELIDTYHTLDTSELGLLLNKYWVKKVDECETYALKGSAQGVKESLDTLISISTRKNKIGDLLRVSFHSKIKAFLAKKSFRSAENIIYSYIDIFGNDTEIKSLMRTFEVLSKTKLAITQNTDTRVQRDKWVESDELMS